MATQIDDPRAPVASFMPLLASFPIVSIVYPDEGAGFDSRSEWSRIAGELEQQEKDEKTLEDSSASSEIKLFRVDQADEDGGEPMRWLFPISIKLIKNEPDAPPATLLERKMADEIDSLYRLYGIDEVFRLSVSIGNSFVANLEAWRKDYADGTREQEEQFDQRDDVLAAATLVDSVYRRQLDALLDRIKEHEKQVREAAVKVARDKLEKAGLEILKETARYLPNVNTVSASTTLETGANPVSMDVWRPDVTALRDSVARIYSRMKAVDNPPPAKPRLFTPSNPLATLPAEDAAHALELELSQACQNFPILHRTWKYLTYFGSAPPDLEMRMAIFGKLSDAWTANRRLLDRIINEPETVWLFPPLIHETLEQLAVENPEYGDLEVGARAAQEKLKLEDPANRITAVLAQIAGFLELAVAVTSPAPPIALTFAGASLVFSLTDSLLEYQQLSDKDDAANSVLDPRKALSSDPSYGFFALGLALSLLDLRGMQNAYRAARVTREVDELGKLVQEGL